MRGQQLTAFKRFSQFDGAGVKHNYPEDYVWLVNWKDYGLPYCSLYVVTPDNEWPCKIGISISPRKRLVALQTSVWRPLQVYSCFWLPTVKDAKALEKKLHETLHDDSRWLHGEWFDMKPDKVVDLIRFTASVEGLEISDTIEEERVVADVRETVLQGELSPSAIRERADMQAKWLGRER